PEACLSQMTTLPPGPPSRCGALEVGRMGGTGCSRFFPSRSLGASIKFIMSEIKPIRLHLLRAMYLLIAVGLGVTVWPNIVAPSNPEADAHTVINAMLGAFSLLALM